MALHPENFTSLSVKLHLQTWERTTDGVLNLSVAVPSLNKRLIFVMMRGEGPAHDRKMASWAERKSKTLQELPYTWHIQDEKNRLCDPDLTKAIGTLCTQEEGLKYLYVVSFLGIDPNDPAYGAPDKPLDSTPSPLPIIPPEQFRK